MLDKPEKLYKDEALSAYQEFSGCFISGQHKHYIFIEAEHSSNMAIKFKLGGAAPFFNFPISKLNNKVQQVEPILGNGISEVRKNIILEKDVSQKFRLIEKYLSGLIRKDFNDNKKFRDMLDFLATRPHEASIKELAAKSGVTQKHLITLFNKQVGLAPKALSRIFRFQKVIMELEKKQKIDWLQVAVDCGYYDQAHFIKDFYTFSGIKPSGYTEQKGDYVNYIPVK